MCGGFTCSKNALIALNILYIVSRPPWYPRGEKPRPVLYHLLGLLCRSHMALRLLLSKCLRERSIRRRSVRPLAQVFGMTAARSRFRNLFPHCWPNRDTHAEGTLIVLMIVDTADYQITAQQHSHRPSCDPLVCAMRWMEERSIVAQTLTAVSCNLQLVIGIQIMRKSDATAWDYLMFVLDSVPIRHYCLEYVWTSSSLIIIFSSCRLLLLYW